jgi:ribosomal protein S12 methylthiotransferase accessory factor
LKFVWTSTAATPHPAAARGIPIKTRGFGVAFTAAAAETKAVAEALELYAASNCADDDLVFSSVARLKEDLVDPRDVCLYYRYSDVRDLPLQRFSSRASIAWTQGQWLDTREPVWLPAFLIYFGARVSMDQSFAPITTSGLATGTSVDDAALRALCELVERDAFIITWLAKLPARRVIPDESLDSDTGAIVRRFQRRGLESRIYLLNAGIDLPVVLSVIFGDGKDWPGATVALGAHPDPIEAVRKAILEQALMGPGIRRMLIDRWIVPRRRREIKTPYDHALYYLRPHRARDFKFLDSTNTPPISLSTLQTPNDLSLESVVCALARAGTRVAIKDLTPPDVAVSSSFRVVRALATGLQPLWFGGETPRLISPRLRRFAKNVLNPRPHPLG